MTLRGLLQGAWVFGLVLLQGLPTLADDHAESRTFGEAIELSPSLGPEIDREERDRLGLFPGIPGFVSGTITRQGDRYTLRYREETSGGVREGTRQLSPEAIEGARLVIRWSDEYDRMRARMAENPELEAAILRRMVLRYSLDQEFDLAIRLLEATRRSDPGSFDLANGARLLVETQGLADVRSPLFLADPLRAGTGRNDLLLFSGYYGIWLGIAVPIALDASSPEAFSLSLLAIPPTTILIAYQATKTREISEAEATMVALGGNFGLWQGVGWSGDNDNEARDVVRSGLVSGLVGVLLGAAVANNDMTEGHAALTDSGAWWGAWFGALAAIADPAPDQALRHSLIGSDIGLLAGFFGARESRFTEGRVRVMNMGGVLGGVAGLGFMGLIRSDNDRVGAASLFFGSVAGGLVALAATDPNPEADDRSAPDLSWTPFLRPHASPDGVLPMVGLATRF